MELGNLIEILFIEYWSNAHGFLCLGLIIEIIRPRHKWPNAANFWLSPGL
jgi:hypothetical protein